MKDFDPIFDLFNKYFNRFILVCVLLSFGFLTLLLAIAYVIYEKI